MGHSEMGIPQTNEYLETYERFMAEYDKGKPVANIAADLLEEYREEFGAEHGILHGVYYALAKCQWMCGGVSGDLMQKVAQIIHSGADLAFYKELGAEEQDLKLRKRNLDRFYKGLQVPRTSIRRRKKSEMEYVPVPKPVFPPMPQVFPGELYAYPDGNQRRLFLVLNVGKSRTMGKTAYCFAWSGKYEGIPNSEMLMKERGIPFGCVPGDAFPDGCTRVGTMEISAKVHALIGYAYPMWRDYICCPAKQDSFYKDLPRHLCLNLETVIRKVTDIQNGIR